MALVRNLRVTPHIDQGDDPEGYVLMTNVGSHKESHLVVGTPNLQYKLAYVPGTALVLFSHENVLKWDV
ncbi:hypothetical protein FFLO_05910 [Filobasidium floriforme]|uniref:Uncharacterized protein n=1 Tax=Filobasidium floriforme TaxID=5210 RepID=A0A8K0NNJ2_9TREE|nr:hypothetical protein FFLO_05910 [Filobasidium floriforme]